MEDLDTETTRLESYVASPSFLQYEFSLDKNTCLLIHLIK